MGKKSTLGARSWKIGIFLVWTLFPGSWAATGPALVTAEEGSSLAVTCSYEPGYELYPKSWCRLKFYPFCFSSVTQTDGSEAVVARGRVSIRDNHTSHSFTVTLSGVTAGDAGSYSCWVKRYWLYNPRHTIEVMVSAVVSITAESNNVSPLTTNPLHVTDSAELPVLSHPGVTHLLLFLSVKLLLALALACGVAWVRSRRGSRDQENLQLLEVAGSTAALSSPPEPQ